MRHNSAVPDAFAEMMKVINYTKMPNSPDTLSKRVLLTRFASMAWSTTLESLDGNTSRFLEAYIYIYMYQNPQFTFWVVSQYTHAESAAEPYHTLPDYQGSHNPSEIS